MVLTRGNYEKILTTDVLWRPVEVKERDIRRPATDDIYVRSTYDALADWASDPFRVIHRPSPRAFPTPMTSSTGKFA